MKNRIGVVILAVVCVGLAIGLVTVLNHSSEQKKADGEVILDYSNKWVNTSGKLDEQKQVAAMYEKDLENEKKAFEELTNNFVHVSQNLSQTSSDLAKTQTSLQESQKEVAKREARISELETQNQALDKQALDLSASITNLTVQIADTQRRLAASEGDKAFLEKELKRLMSEKAELERQFNDLTVLRAQVAKLKDELNIARRLEWIRQGIFARSEQKGAQQLMQGGTAPQVQAKAAKPIYDLNVEITADGSVKVIPPLSTSARATNSPPAK
jgi:chromosome segregation ATPase